MAILMASLFFLGQPDCVSQLWGWVWLCTKADGFVTSSPAYKLPRRCVSKLFLHQVHRDDLKSHVMKTVGPQSESWLAAQTKPQLPLWSKNFEDYCSDFKKSNFLMFVSMYIFEWIPYTATVSLINASPAYKFLVSVELSPNFLVPLGPS